MNDPYEVQRTMRSIRKAALQRGVIAVLDVGTSKIACLVLKFEMMDHLKEAEGIGPMAGYAGFRVIGVGVKRSLGVNYGEIEAMRETENAIRSALQAAQKMANTRVDYVIACLSGAKPRSYGLAGKIELKDQAVSEEDIGNVLSCCEVPDYGEGREVLHAQPVNFALDNRTGLLDPRGQIGQELSVDMHVLTVDATPVRNLAQCVKRSDMELAGLANSAYLSGISAMVEDEKELGAACIDLGGGSTGISIFLRKHMIYADSVRIGGKHVTRDISMGLQISEDQAERIKTLYGGVVATSIDDREFIPMTGETGDWDHDRRSVSRADLIGIIRPRVAEILEEVAARLEAAGFNCLPSHQIVLTGGGSQIPGLDRLASSILGQNVRLGRPLRVHGLPQSATGPGFASIVGMCLSAAHPQDEWWDFGIPIESYPKRSLKRALNWITYNW
ncbi:MAG: cell division protein FtsA [Roseovarius sp.]|nr:cell division protein FtsA [Roseovarius sp.]MCY4207919.1 cell division protein FtsA [Roseovarius sp.]MCY4293134.1 cell division protein FtsA [Roseovarius sp.]MCY4314762.1 cell division protein FtsA [Roseovarius sp.]